MHLKTLGQIKRRHLQMVKTVSLLTLLTIEMGMLVVIMLLTMTVTQFISRPVAAAFDSMHQMMLTKKSEGTEHVRLIDRQNPTLQLRQ